MANIFDKDSWSEHDFKVYFHNLDRLRKQYRLSKGGLNKAVGLQNLYRRDINKPGREAISTICLKFNVTEDWLGTDHSNDPKPGADSDEGGPQPNGRYRLVIPMEDPLNSGEVRQGAPGYAPGAPDEWEAIGLLSEIVKDGDPAFRRAIMANLVAFSTAIRERKKSVELESEVAELKAGQAAHAAETEKVRQELAELRGIVQAQTRAIVYAGIERRTDTERRVTIGESPNGNERRSGLDRRVADGTGENHT